MITIDNLEKILNSNKAIKELTRYEIASESFKRGFSFFIRDFEYKIEWWSNIGYLLIEEAEIIFDNVRINTTWPEHYQNFLEFLNCNDGIVAIIPLEKYQ